MIRPWPREHKMPTSHPAVQGKIEMLAAHLDELKRVDAAIAARGMAAGRDIDLHAGVGIRPI